MGFFLKKSMFPDFEETNNLSFKGRKMVLFVYIVFNIDSNAKFQKKNLLLRAKKYIFVFH